MKSSTAGYFVSVTLPMVFASLLLLQQDFIIELQCIVFDRYQRVSPRVWDPEAAVRIVDIDDESLEKHGQWPWPRTLVAQLQQRLQEAGAAAIAFDMSFAEADRHSAEQVVAGLVSGTLRERVMEELKGLESNDARFARQIAGGRVVLGSILVEREGANPFPVKFGLSEAGDPALPFLNAFPGAVLPLPALAESADGVGALNWVPDRDQIIRTVPLFFSNRGQAVPSLVAEALRVAQGASGYILRASNASGQSTFGVQTGVNAVRVGQLTIGTGPAADVRPRFSPTERRRFLPAWKILAGEVQPDEIEGRILFVGTSAAGLRDQRATPIDASVSGVEVHAQLAENILEGKSLSRPDWASGFEILLGIVQGLAIAVLLPLTSPIVGAAGGALLAICAVAGGLHLFNTHGILVDTVLPSLFGGLVYLSGLFFLWRHEKAQRRYVRSAFGKYVSPAVVEQLVNDPGKLAIGGETRVLTVMFVDLRSFTTISEGMDAQAVTRFMNAYLTPMTDIVIEEKGTVDKYMGDAIMAFWNAPLDDPDHAANAVRAALRMRAALDALNVVWRAEAEAAGRKPHQVKFGIGINTGRCSVGNMGSLRRFDYSAMGDSVNLASRLEGASKQYGVDILVSDTTMQAAPGFAWIEIDRLQVKGKSLPTTVYGLAGDPDAAVQPAMQAWLTRHAEWLDAYRQRDFSAAADLADELAEEVPSPFRGLYGRLSVRARRLASELPPPDWDGTTILDEK